MFFSPNVGAHENELLDNAPPTNKAASNEKLASLNNGNSATIDARITSGAAVAGLNNGNNNELHQKLPPTGATFAATDTDDSEGLDDLVNQNKAAATTSSADNTPGV